MCSSDLLRRFRPRIGVKQKLTMAVNAGQRRQLPEIDEITMHKHRVCRRAVVVQEPLTDRKPSLRLVDADHQLFGK